MLLVQGWCCRWSGLEIGAAEATCCLWRSVWARNFCETFGNFWELCTLPSKMENLHLVCFAKALQSESRLCRLGRSVSKQLGVIICLIEVITFLQ